MKKLTAIIVAIITVVAMCIPANAFGSYYAVQYGVYVSAYKCKNDYVDDEFNRTEIFDEDDAKLQIDKQSVDQLHIEGYGWLPPADSDKLMLVEKLAKRCVIRRNAKLYDYYGDAYDIDKGDTVYLTGAKRNGMVGVMVPMEEYNAYGWMRKSDIGVKRKIKRRCHVYGTASKKHPTGYIGGGKVVYIDKTKGTKWSHILGGGWVRNVWLGMK